MQTQFRLNSLVPDGVGGPEAGAIDLIYQFLFVMHKQSAYSSIFINQIGDDLQEVIKKKGKQIYINIRYPVPKTWALLNSHEKNCIRLEIMHIGLLRIASKENKIDINALESIKSTILKNNFSFDFICKNYSFKKNNGLTAQLIVHPDVDSFHYYVQIEEQGKVKCKLPIYNGFTTTYFIIDLFWYGKWKNKNEFVLTGKKREIEIHITVNSCEVKYINLTSYEKPPYFEMFRSDITDEEREKAAKNWKDSLPHIPSYFSRDDNN
jgi:hypothetical protein